MVLVYIPDILCTYCIYKCIYSNCNPNYRPLLPNVEGLLSVDEYGRGCIWQLKNANTIYIFHKLEFDRGDSSLECFNRTNQNYWLVTASSSQISYVQGRIMKYEKCMCRDCLFFSDTYILVYYALYHHKLTNLTARPYQLSMSATLGGFCCLLVNNLAALYWTISGWFHLYCRCSGQNKIDFTFIVGVPGRTSDGIVRDL